MSQRIEEYALLGDCHSAALVAKNGSIDWLCLPRFDSPACLAALVGTPEHGRWRIAPTEEACRVSRRYRPGTLILETDFFTDSGEVRIIDFMPPRTTAPDLCRIVVGRGGRIPMHCELVIRFDYGSIVPWVRHTEGGIRAVAGPDRLDCRSTVRLCGEDLKTVADFTVKQGDQVPFTLVWSRSHDDPPDKVDAWNLLEETERFWKDWTGRSQYEGPWKEAVERSLVTLKALTYAPTGAVVAAPTTSLPNKIGGVRNFDFRFCWLRDATFTLYALINCGFVEEAKAWRNWLVDAVAGTPDQLQIMYGISGERRLTEQILDWLPGYESSKPVRIGNAAHDQHQLDVYGEVLDALHVARRTGLDPDENAWRVERAMVRFLETDWNKPDHGIWEVRGPQRHFTHSKVMAWVAVDRAVQAVEQHGLPGDLEKWTSLRDEIHRQVCAEGFNSQVNSFVQYYGSTEPDASLLMIPLVGFLPARDARIQGTVEYIKSNLMEDGLVHRYQTNIDVDGLPPGEATFLLCTFWMADNLVLQGEHAEALELFQRLLDLRNDVGLLSEEYDVHAQRMLGNFPQAYSHTGIINTAQNLSRSGGPAHHRQRAEADDS